MSFFAGRIGTKTVLSLNSASGGDINVHLNPNTNTIFHSDMPYVIIQEQYSANLGAVGSDYYVCDMPAAVANYVSNTSRILIPMLTVNYGGVEYNTILGGGSMSLGNCTAGGTELNLGTTMATAECGAQLRNIWGFSNDVVWDTGYYTKSSSLSDVLSIGQGTGRSIDIMSASLYYAATYSTGGGGIGIPPIPDLDQSYLYLASGAIYSGRIPSVDQDGRLRWADEDRQYNTKIGSVTRTIAINSHFQTPTGRSLGHSKFYVRRGIAALVKAWRVRYNQGAGTGETLVQRYTNSFYAQSGDRIDEVWQRTSFHSNTSTVIAPDTTGTYLNVDYKASLYNMVTPVRMTWFVTNVTYNESAGTYSASNPFTVNNDIRLSPSDFIIKGVNLGTTAWSFLMQLSAGALYNANGRVVMGANGSRSTAKNGSSAAAIPIPYMSGTTERFIGGDTTDGWQLHKLALYQFNRNRQWKVDTRSNSISNAEGDVWSPGVNPLKIFAGNSSVVNVGGNTLNSNTGEVLLTTVNLGMNTNVRAGSVICSVQLRDATVFTSGGYGSFVICSPRPGNPESLGLSASTSRMRTSGGIGAVHHHLFCTLPVGRFVPVYAIRTAGYNFVLTPSFQPLWFTPSNVQMSNRTLECSFIIYLKNEGNGNVGIYCGTGRNADAAAMGNFSFILPNLRISVQRLT
ncbi:hypothetical protein U7154_000083 [Kononvirus KKP3711]|uniref:Receptor-binding tail protein n=1 Tax=Enterobacter phage KKP_3711 TaxID=3109398 RepID=A0AAX4Q507_9CAUD